MNPGGSSITSVSCPYCGEAVEIVIEDDLLGETVLDCEVCCNPWRLTVHRDGSSRRIEVARLDD